MEEHVNALAVYEQLSKKDQKETTKPKMSKELRTGLTLMCMCCKSNCTTRADGSGCHNCKVGADNGERPALVRNAIDGYLECSCAACNCNCNAVFGTNERVKFQQQLLDQAAKQKEPEKDNGPTGE